MAVWIYMCEGVHENENVCVTVYAWVCENMREHIESISMCYQRKYMPDWGQDIDNYECKQMNDYEYR